MWIWLKNVNTNLFLTDGVSWGVKSMFPSRFCFSAITAVGYVEGRQNHKH